MLQSILARRERDFYSIAKFREESILVLYLTFLLLSFQNYVNIKDCLEAYENETDNTSLLDS